jgi:hypothetical protein
LQDRAIDLLRLSEANKFIVDYMVALQQRGRDGEDVLFYV